MAFKQAVHHQVKHYLEDGLPTRAKMWSDTLLKYYRPNASLSLNEFVL